MLLLLSAALNKLINYWRSWINRFWQASNFIQKRDSVTGVFLWVLQILRTFLAECLPATLSRNLKFALDWENDRKSWNTSLYDNLLRKENLKKNEDFKEYEQWRQKSRKHCFVFQLKYFLYEFKHSYTIFKNHPLSRMCIIIFPFVQVALLSILEIIYKNPFLLFFKV